MFAWQIFQLSARSGNVDNNSFNFTLSHPLSLWKLQNDIFENLVLWPKYFRAEVGIGPEMCRGPKYAWGQSECGAKLGVSSNMEGTGWGFSASSFYLSFYQTFERKF